MYFFLVFPLSTTKNLVCYINNKYKTTLKGEKKTNQLGTLGPKEQHGGEFFGFSFCLIFSESWN